MTIHPGAKPCDVWDEGTSGYERACIGNREQVCPNDGTPLTCLDDYTGGGSHYWTLRCDTCQRGYYFDTYRFKLEGADIYPMSDRVTA